VQRLAQAIDLLLEGRLAVGRPPALDDERTELVVARRERLEALQHAVRRQDVDDDVGVELLGSEPAPWGGIAARAWK
jgi:hypothetical protein